MATTFDYLPLVALLFMATVVWFTAFKSLIRARTIEDIPTSKIRSAHQGYVEITGFARQQNKPILASPLSGEPCLWFQYKVEKYSDNGKSESWKTISSGRSQTPIIIDDDGSSCFVLPNNAEISTSHKRQWYGNTSTPQSPLNQKGLFNKNYRYTEELIKPEDFLYALGHFHTEHPASQSEQINEHKAILLSEWKQDYQGLLSKYDNNQDGKIDLQEWEEVRVAAEQEAIKLVLNDFNHEPINTLRESDNGRQPFIVSNKDPKQLSRHYRHKAIGMTVLALLLSGFAVFKLLP